MLVLYSQRVRVLGRRNFGYINNDKGLIIVANHASFIDSLVLLYRLPFVTRFTVYKSAFKVPFLNRLYRGAGYIGVGMRGFGSAKGVQALFKALKQKERIIIYSDVEKEENRFEFSRSIVRLANEFNIPILPIAIKGAARVMPLGQYMLNPGIITLAVGKPSSYFTSPKELKQAVIELYEKIA